jgi:hypothetical protein
MAKENELLPSSGALQIERTSAEKTQPPLALDRSEKGSLRSMWELLTQLRFLLPYLTRLVPLLDKGLLKAPDLTDVRKGIQEVHSGSRELGVLVRNQALQLERLEEQMTRVRETAERNQKEIRELSVELHSIGSWIRAVAILLSITLLALLGLGAFVLTHMNR